ncbi:uncharacterized protein LOC111314216 isoform X2 [Durio zibethinus]|uniref:Uncharacterized protein LOC111314216 isoform X2 n=1 Tax=Durio zibethinus TaxID=66656 RepID=A0A6P6B221_DURZI|nr:uncharacterized protein LOC111314216 isoform X2 [Durio zibethinus]
MAKTPIKYYVVDAFTDSAFKGNPAAVCLLEEERDEKWLQAVAAEFNISETCYLTRITDSASPNARFRLRWFTPVAEVKLCGHATLASAHTLFTTGLVNSDIIEFDTLSGILTAKKVPDVHPTAISKIQKGGAHECFLIELNFPTVPITEFNSDEVSAIAKALNGAPLIDIKRTTTADDIFDPVCGSAHCALAPYWSQKLGKCDFIAHAASPRGGKLNIHLDEQNQRVFLRGKAVTVMEGSLLV